MSESVVCAFAVLVVATLSRASPGSGTFGLAIDDRRRCPPDRHAPILA